MYLANEIMENMVNFDCVLCVHRAQFYWFSGSTNNAIFIHLYCSMPLRVYNWSYLHSIVAPAADRIIAVHVRRTWMWCMPFLAETNMSSSYRFSHTHTQQTYRVLVIWYRTHPYCIRQNLLHVSLAHLHALRTQTENINTFRLRSE